MLIQFFVDLSANFTESNGVNGNSPIAGTVFERSLLVQRRGER